ncbi:hypothetical protein LCGC14_0399340 [marine sediment metagenome]|uniref:GH16 domain-containing protein n=1 Tax=marine sediment metagenome TaxID=412755 RepID=A0A0F9W6E5_9ZZZZ
MPKLLSIKNFLGMNTTKRKLPPQQAREISDMVSERGLTRTRPGFGKYNVLAQSGAILGIFDYRRKNGQKGYLFADANGDWWEWEQFHFGPEEDGGDNFWWTVMYEANEMPDVAYPVWILYDQLNKCSVSNGILTIPFTAEVSNEIVVYQEDVMANNATGNILEIRAKGVGLESSGPNAQFSIRDGTKQSSMAIRSDKILGGASEYVMDTMDDYHIYRLTAKGTNSKVYVDGVLRITFTPSSNALNKVYFGLYSPSGLSCSLLIDYVRYYTGGF